MPSTEAALPAERLYMDAVITPNRSLSRKGLYVLLGFFAVYNTVVALFLVLVGAFPVPVFLGVDFLAVLGAFPVPLFLGVDFLAVLAAFHFSNKRARQAERVQVSLEAVKVTRDDGQGQPETVWTSPTAFTRVTVEAEDDAPEVWLKLSGRAMAVAQALSPRERTDFAQALDRAIRRAQEERYGPVT